MTLIKNSAEAGTNGTACTGGSGGNTGGTSGRYFDTVSIAGSATITFSNARAQSGTLSYAMNTNATDAQYLEWIPAATNAAFAARGYVYLPSLPSAGNAFINLRTASAGTSLLTVVITNLTVNIQDTTPTTQWTSSVALPTAQWLRWELKATNGTTTTGTVQMDWYVGDSTTPITGLSASLSGQNFGTVAFGRIRIGRPGAPSGSWASFNMDNLAYNDGATTYIGPNVNTPPTVTVSGNQNVSAGATVNLTATPADSDGAVVSQLWTFDVPSSSPPTLTGATTTTPSFIAGSAPNLYILRCTVTDDLGATGYATTEVRVPASASGEIRPVSMAATEVGTWTNTGGASTDGAATADESDSTYLESGSISATEQSARFRINPTTTRATGQINLRLGMSAGTGTWAIRLYEGATLRQSWSQSSVPVGPTDYTFTVSSGTLSAISDWGNLFIEAGVTT